jgi:xanthine/uracil/vitamin C permease (AzgA family)
MDFHTVRTRHPAFDHGNLSFCDRRYVDTVERLIGTAGNAGMLDKDGNLPGGDQALIADAIATCVGACMGTSTVTTYVESSRASRKAAARD